MSSKFNLSFVRNLTLTEKAALVTGKNYWYTADNKKREIPSIMMTDGPSGLRKQAEGADALGLNGSVEAVCFPTAALTACSFDKSMLFKLGQNLGQAAKAENISILLGPGVNIKRSPLAGRNFEYFSEDPYLAGELGSSYVQGVQSQKVGVSVKHFAANNRENQRFTASSNIDERTLREIYLKAFEKIVKTAQPATLMCSYNELNGVLNSQNHRLLTQILRNEWGFQGAVMSDWGAVADHVAALNAGLDLEMPGNGKDSVHQIVTAVQNGQLEESVLDTAALRVLHLVEKYVNSQTVHSSSYDKAEQHDFARQAAEDSLVLLKNEHQILPLQNNDHIALIGALAKTPRYQGGGSSHVNSYRVVTPLDAAQQSDYDFDYAPGYSLNTNKPDKELVNAAIKLAQENDKVIFFAGVPEQDESEGFDKETLDLPDNQVALIKQLAQVNPNLIVVLQNGSVVTMPWRDSALAILETYLAGEAVGEATWNILTGATNPSGKLAETFPIRLEDNPTYGTFNASKTQENYHEGIFVGYRYYDLKNKAVNYPFGYGLSYTTFKYSNLVIQNTTDHVIVEFDIQNTGQVAGQEIAQLYVRNLVSAVEMPVQELQGISKVYLQPGESKTVQLKLTRPNFAWYNKQNSAWQTDQGEYEIRVGKSSRQIELRQRIQLAIGTKPSKTVNLNTYLKDIIHRSDLKNALAKAGLQSSINQILQSDSNAELLENMPLRALVMLGASMQQIETFLKLVQNKNS
ncbi:MULTISPECIES: glycoside hydrolase family 3 C-terminal domain-containing protein [unclassified Lactobacillus]|uniref:glycoside hydrolase family 3 C-terminal domain-containing protein n=1 Tax=unclassified Lactobacillus TaxID=2620435 RepID=UPI002269E1BD|nr:MULTISPECIES: glycoside hydrolase family 3 C-terminal domain-containing protein [unclassified Lactobacillus]MCX8720618.1 glycoside hydrolase family 3 C-terminal domain-containing protein [Lactobacillus sp. B4010]MCX8731359.1 glycoside hydrolase family 3 C-terminal domain-containing protein [Lactobacillus sp. B4015]MCX8733580.1 glycoside hydrolase family 3 C-terminal domain-containing protein [Lactobacillus sp. B4012]